ncbi:MAG: ADOP family duplicated permease [Terriglobales bacterium]
MFGRKRRERDMEAEFAFHLEREAAERQAEGLPPSEARRQARLALGGEDQWKEAAREQRRGARVELWLREFRLAWRGLWRRPGFALSALAILVLGIGVTSAMFSVIYAVMLHPLPFPQAKRLVYIWSGDQTHPGSQSVLSYPDFLDLRRTPGFSGMAALTTQDMPLTGRGAALHVRAAAVSANLFSLLGAPAPWGRTFLPGEDRPGSLNGADPTVLSYALAKRRFGSARAALGQALTLNGMAFRVVGVMPAGFQFPLDDHEDLWTTIAPLQVSSQGPPLTAQRSALWMEVVARLAPGVSPAAAGARLATEGAVLRQRYPETDRNETFHLQNMLSAYTSSSQAALWMLFAAVACVLLIAGVNLAGLLLARQARRRHEFALRLALGAGRGALWRQWSCESLLLGALGAGGGLALAFIALAVLVPDAPGDVVRLPQAHLNGTVFGFTIALGVVTALAAGIASACSLRLRHANAGLLPRSQAAARLAPRRWRRSLIGTQFAVALIVLVAALLLLASLARLVRAPLGFHSAGVLTASVNMPDARYPTAAALASFSARLLDHLRQQPGVAAAATSAYLPFQHGFSIDFRDVNHPAPGPPAGSSLLNIISPGYFHLLAIPLLAGRTFTSADVHASPPAAVVNQAFVRRFLAGQPAVGRRIQPGIASFTGGPQMRQIVGVVADTRQGALSRPAPPLVYIPQQQVPFPDVVAFVRARPGDEAAAASELRQTVARLDSDIPIYDLKPLSEYRQAKLAPWQFSVWLLAVFAGLALVLAAVGLYGVMAQAVTERRREIAVRMALGAGRHSIIGMVLGEGMALAAAGCGVGLLAAWVLSRALGAQLSANLYATSPLDPVALAGAMVVLLAAAWLACVLPARRAATADPAAVLRAE